MRSLSFLAFGLAFALCAGQAEAQLNRPSGSGNSGSGSTGSGNGKFGQQIGQQKGLPPTTQQNNPPVNQPIKQVNPQPIVNTPPKTINNPPPVVNKTVNPPPVVGKTVNPPPLVNKTTNPPPVTTNVNPPPVVGKTVNPPPLVNKTTNPPPVTTNVNPPPVVGKTVNPPPLVNKTTNPPPVTTNVNPPPVVGKTVNPPPLVNKTTNPPPVTTNVNPPPVVGKTVNPPPLVNKTTNPPPVTTNVNPPPVVGKTVNPPPLVNKTTNPPPVTTNVNPPPVVGKTVNPPPLVNKTTNPPPVTTKLLSPTKVLTSVDKAKNPPTKIDTAKVDPNKLAGIQKNMADNLKKGQESLITQNKAAAAERIKAAQEGKNALNKTLTPAQIRQADDFAKIRTKAEETKLATKKVAPPKISNDPSKLIANAPKTSTRESAKAFSLTTNDNKKIIDLKNSATDPYARKVYDDVLTGRQLSRSETAYLQAQLNNPSLNNASKATIASALQNQADIRRQGNYIDAISRLNGGGGYRPYPYPPPQGGGGFGPAFTGGLVGGLVGTLVGNLVYPGQGVIVPGGYQPGYVLPGNVPFNPTGLVGYIDYSPAVYYPPIDGLAMSGSVVVQTLPCGCAETVYSSPVQTVEPGNPGVVNPDPQQQVDPIGSPAIVIDPTSQEVKLTTRYLRLVNSSKEKVTVSIVLRTPADDGSFVWLPEEPGKGDGAFTVELMPGEEKDIYSGDTQLHGSRARIWATGESGKTWRHNENEDFWLVPEIEEDLTHAYSAPGMETAVYNLQ